MALLCPAKVRSTPLGHFRTPRTSRPEELWRGQRLAPALADISRVVPPFSPLPSSCFTISGPPLNKYLNANGTTLTRAASFARDRVITLMPFVCERIARQTGPSCDEFPWNSRENSTVPTACFTREIPDSGIYATAIVRAFSMIVPLDTGAQRMHARYRRFGLIIF